MAGGNLRRHPRPIRHPPPPKQEPPALNLPVKNFTVAADIGKFYLREVEITHLQTTVKADGGHVTSSRSSSRSTARR